MRGEKAPLSHKKQPCSEQTPPNASAVSHLSGVYTFEEHEAARES